MSSQKYWLGFNLAQRIGPAAVQALLDHCGSAEAAWQASEATWRAAGLDVRAVVGLAEARRRLDLDRELARVAEAGVALITWADEGYPRRLREIPYAPPLLYVRGAIAEADGWAVAIVGTRRLTDYGRQVTAELAAGLARSGVTVVSGLARGIDAVAHETAVAGGGRTIAVLGSGVDAVYPPEHRRLAARIAGGNGAVISEYGLGVQPEARNFPPRNRLICGLSLGVVVVEAGERSGALITVRFALEQNREVFAVPGNINSPASAGPNRLLREGAHVVTGVDDILAQLNLSLAPQQTAVQMALPETAAEAALLKHLSLQPRHVDELGRAAGLASADASSTLTIMELKGMVRAAGAMRYVRAHG